METEQYNKLICKLDCFNSKIERQNAIMEKHNAETAEIALRQSTYSLDLRQLDSKIDSSNKTFWLGIAGIAVAFMTGLGSIIVAVVAS